WAAFPPLVLTLRRLSEVLAEAAEGLRVGPLALHPLDRELEERPRLDEAVLVDHRVGLLELLLRRAVPLGARPEAVEVGDDGPLGGLQGPQLLDLDRPGELLLKEWGSELAPAPGRVEVLAAVELELGLAVPAFRPG